jgi:Uma2 family endonuclease
MCAMPVMPRVGEWTVDDLDDLPDDGLQYELADGVLLVSPAPRPLHQRVIARVYLLLHAAAPPDVEVFFAPLDYRPTSRTSLQPDLLVVRCDDVGELNVTAPLVLAVEVLSPSTRAKDLPTSRCCARPVTKRRSWSRRSKSPSYLPCWSDVDGCALRAR